MNLIVLAAAALLISAGTQSTGHHSNTHVSASVQYSTYDRNGNELFVSLRSGDPYYGYDRFYYDDNYYYRCEPVYVDRPIFLFEEPVYVVHRPFHVVRQPVYVRQPIYVQRPVYVTRGHESGWSRSHGDDRHFASSGRVEVRSSYGKQSHGGGEKSHGGKGNNGKHGRD